MNFRSFKSKLMPLKTESSRKKNFKENEIDTANSYIGTEKSFIRVPTP